MRLRARDKESSAQGSSPFASGLPTFEPLKHLFTGVDNQTLDLGRVSWALCFVAVALHDTFKPGSLQELAIALGAVVAAHGIALGLKAKTEPGG